jgi:hypothetical protein
MDRYVSVVRKRQKLNVDTAGSVHKDCWHIIIGSHLDWPELFAMTKVSRRLRALAMPLLTQKIDPVRVEMIWKRINYLGRRINGSRPRHRWYIIGFERIPFETLEHPRLVNNTSFFGLLCLILRRLRRRNPGRFFGQPFLRFARIAGIFRGPPLREWNALKGGF